MCSECVVEVAQIDIVREKLLVLYHQNLLMASEVASLLQNLVDRLVEIDDLMGDYLDDHYA